jgi:hypothetical protein
MTIKEECMIVSNHLFGDMVFHCAICFRRKEIEVAIHLGITFREVLKTPSNLKSNQWLFEL